MRCGQARCAESLYRRGVITSPARPCGESHQTTRHIVEECPLTAFPGGLRRLHEAGPGAVEWLSRLSLKLRECSKRTTTTQYIGLHYSQYSVQFFSFSHSVAWTTIQLFGHMANVTVIDHGEYHGTRENFDMAKDVRMAYAMATRRHVFLATRRLTGCHFNT